MKVLISTCLLIGYALLFSNARAQQDPSISIDGSDADQNFTSCSAIHLLDFTFSSLLSYENNASGSQSFEYQIELVRNGSVIADKLFQSGDEEIACHVGCPPLFYVFEDIDPQSGYYYAQLKVRRYIFGVYAETVVYNAQSNIINVTRPDDGTYATCVGTDSDNSANICGKNNTEVYQFVSAEYFVVQKNNGLVYKFSNINGTGDNMFGITTNPVGNTPGYSNLMGSHDFATPITDMVYTSDGKTIISFSDGKILKINGTGGSGATMFAVTESASGFANISPYTYYSGHDKFLSKINDLFIKDNKLFIGCDNGNLLKINGSGGSGSDMFAVNESATAFTNISPYTYFSGSQHFSAGVREMYSIGAFMFIATNNGKLLKINNTGGSGDNMFAISENATGYTTLSGYTYYSGNMFFQSSVSKMYAAGAYTFIACDNGKILKINGVGGNGNNMFAVTEIASGFTNISPYTYYVGSSAYSSAVTAFAQNSTATKLFIGFANGKMMKIQNVGGTGNDMFNATETAQGFSTSSTLYTIQLSGSTNFNSKVTDIKFFGTKQIICLNNNKMLKITGDGGTGNNMYAVSQQAGGFRPLLGYPQYLAGSQFLQCSSPIRSASATATGTTGRENSLMINAYPNPFNSTISVDLPEELRTEDVSIEIYEVTGKLVLSTSGANAREINTENFKPGMYMIYIKSGKALLNSIKATKL